MTTAASQPHGKPFVGELLGRSDYAIIGEIVEPGAKVLDLGCGEGELLQWLAENKGVDARGVDALPGAVGDLVRQFDIVEALIGAPQFAPARALRHTQRGNFDR